MDFWRGKFWASILLLGTYPLFMFGALVLWALASSPDFSGTGPYDRFMYVPLMLAAVCSIIATRLVWRAFAEDGRGVRITLAVLAFMPFLLTTLLFVLTLIPG